jgi:2Fe-2S ferredoxin
MIRIIYQQRDGRAIEAEGRVGQTVRDLAMKSGVKGILGECGGNCACATCHVQIADEWIGRVGRVAKDGVEDSTLDFCTDRTEFSRLSCQIPIRPELDGLVVTVGNDG